MHSVCISLQRLKPVIKFILHKIGNSRSQHKHLDTRHQHFTQLRRLSDQEIYLNCNIEKTSAPTELFQHVLNKTKHYNRLVFTMDMYLQSLLKITTSITSNNYDRCSYCQYYWNRFFCKFTTEILQSFVIHLRVPLCLQHNNFECLITLLIF